MKRHRPGKSLMFVVDEVGQFVARDIQKMLDLQAVVQQLGVKGKGKHWIVVTSQEKLNELVSGLDSRQIELARLMDRFPLQVHLEPSDISEVTSRRVLAKNAEAETILGKLFEDNRGRLIQHTRMSADISLPEVDRQSFVDLYPLLPYQIDLIIQIVSGLRTQSGASRHVGGANRTIIKLAQQLLINPQTRLAEHDIGALVRLDHVYDLVEGNISSEIRAKIASIPSKAKHRLAHAVAKVICLLQFERRARRSAENIAAALHGRVDADSCLTEVREALTELEEALLVRDAADGYRIPTPAEDDWEQVRSSFEPKRADENRLIAEVFVGFWTPAPTFNLGDTKSFKAGLMVNGKDEASGDITFNVQIADDAASAAKLGEEVRVRSQSEPKAIFWVVTIDEDIRREMRDAYRSQQMIEKKGRDTTTADGTALIAEEKVRQRRHMDELRRRLRTAALSGQIWFRGNDRSPDANAGDIGKTASSRLGIILPLVYDRFAEASAKPADLKKGVEALFIAENLNGLPPVFSQLNLLRDEGGKPVFKTDVTPLSEVMSQIEARANYGEQATGKFVEDEFSKAPFGWDFEAVRLLTLSLLRAGSIEAVSKGVDDRGRHQRAGEGVLLEQQPFPRHQLPSAEERRHEGHHRRRRQLQGDLRERGQGTDRERRGGGHSARGRAERGRAWEGSWPAASGAAAGRRPDRERIRPDQGDPPGQRRERDLDLQRRPSIRTGRDQALGGPCRGPDRAEHQGPRARQGDLGQGSAGAG